MPQKFITHDGQAIELLRIVQWSSLDIDSNLLTPGWRETHIIVNVHT